MNKMDTPEIPRSVLEDFADFPDAEALRAEIGGTPIDYELDPEFVAAYLKTQFVEDIYGAMADRGIRSKSELAEHLGKSRQYVGRVLNETANFTLESLAEIACALGMRITLRMHKPGTYMAAVSVKDDPGSSADPTNGSPPSVPGFPDPESRPLRPSADAGSQSPAAR
ncbi:MAG: helix-turn-helix transcriptional regulator [Candidatus Hydrogenedentes bacterium]|nr:helix-turn-helix transcriptional regulator [Candidatus Hydrogenedentota bacterium]